MLPMSEKEIRNVRGSRLSQRRTFKVRIVFPKNQSPPVTSFRVFSPHEWKEVDLRIGAVTQTRSRPLEITSASVFFGHLSSPLKPLRSGDRIVAYLLGVIYSDSPTDSPDRTLVTLRWGETEAEGVSFLPAEAVREDVFLPDFGLCIAQNKKKRSGQGEPLRTLPAPQTIWQKVTEEPEQTYRRARADIPPLRVTAHRPYGSYVPLGCEANRQEFGVLYNGNIFLQKGSLKSPGREDARMLWPGCDLLCKIGTGASPDFREREGVAHQSLLEGYLPVVNTEWETAGILFRESAVASLLVAEDVGLPDLRGDETSVLLLSLTAENPSAEPLPVRVWFATSLAEPLQLKDGFVHAQPSEKQKQPYPSPPLRCFVDSSGNGGSPPWTPSTADNSPGDSIFFETTLQPKAKQKIVFKIPFLSVLTDQERSRLRSMDFDQELRRTVSYWRDRIQAGANIRVPNPLLNDFLRAHLWHVAVTADKDVDTGFTMLPAATFHYKVCANEACHQIRSLDLRGYPELAEECLEPFVRLQGTRPLHGRFRSSEGVLHGLRVKEKVDYQTFNYNLDHGFVLWMLCEHFRLTGDTQWLGRIAPNLVKACDFIIRERKATQLTDPDGRYVWQFGLLPPGHLEDNPEFLYWYAVNAYACRGMSDAADVLSQIAFPDADRIREESAHYLTDLRRAVRQSMLLAPVVNQGNGTYIPLQPTRCFLRGRDLGWIRDSLYGPIHLIACGIYPWHSPEATWILQDAENNVFVSPERGLGIDIVNSWFSHGGITLQPNLVPTPIVYIKRDEPERAIRCFYNTLAASVYEDVRAFCEWLPARFGRGGGPFFKTPDESAFIVWLRYLLAVEDGDALTLCPTAPREWFAHGQEISVQDVPTYFGQLSFRIVSHTDDGGIRARVLPPSRRVPRELRLRIRHPHQKPMRAVRINDRPFSHFDVSKEWIVLPASGRAIDIVVTY